MNQQTHPTATEIETALGLNPGQRRNRWQKRLLALLLLFVVAAAAYYAWFAKSNSATRITYETVAATKADVLVQVTATGTVQPLTQVDISSEASGVVREVKVTENAIVKKGDVLAVLDTTRLESQQAKAQAQVWGAKARLEQGQATMAEALQTENRQKALRQKGLSTGQDMDSAQAASKRAEAALAAAEADVQSAQADAAAIATDIEKMRVVSPIDGMVLKRSVEPGQTVASSLQAPVLFQIAQDLSHMQVEAAVDEADIGDVKAGQAASFTVDAYRRRSFPAKIESLSYAPETVDGVVTYKATLSASNEDLSLRPGMTATARITVEDYRQQLAVPNEALRFAPPQQAAAQAFSITSLFMPRMPRNTPAKRTEAADGTRAIYILKDGVPAELRVKTGATDGKMTIVTSDNLQLNDPVIIAQKQAAK